MLAISAIKACKLNGKGREVAIELAFEIADQNLKLYTEVIRSPEYRALLMANEDLFDGVEKVRHGDGMSAKDFDNLNQARHRAKQALQKRFWNNELTEVKT